MQRLINELRVSCHHVQLTIEPTKCEFMMFNSTPAQRKAAPPFRVWPGCVKQVADSVTYLGLLLDSTCSSTTMMRHRFERAEAMYRRACAFAATANIHHLQPLETVFASTVMASALYGVEAWGLDAVPSMDVFDNHVQQLAAKFVKIFIKLPKRSSKLITILESGFTLVTTHAYRRLAAGVTKAMTLNSPALTAAMHYPAVMARWHEFVTTQLGVAWSLDQPPPKPSVLAKHACHLYDTHLQPYVSMDTRAVDCQHRTTADYIQHVWNKKYGKPHKVHTSCTIPCRTYRWFCRVRTLTFPAASYTHHYKPGRTPLCAFGCDVRGDITHCIKECPHTCAIAPSHTLHDDNAPHTAQQQAHTTDARMRSIFSEDTDPHTAAHLAMLLCAKLRDNDDRVHGQP
jgi:hypothetical protein